MSAPTARRGFLRGLVSLPLIGGGVTLIGQPTAAATPITPGLLATYSAWLYIERRKLHWASLVQKGSEFVPHDNPAIRFHDQGLGDVSAWGQDAQLRAPIVLAAAGCPLSSAEAEANWRGTFWRGAEVVQ